MTEKEKQRKREYYLKHRETMIEKAKIYSAAHPEQRKRIMHKWYKKYKNPNAVERLPMSVEEAKRRRMIRQNTVNARRRGEIIREPSCLKCGKICKTEAHHYNGYSKEAMLDLVWLCQECHKSMHVF
jgi:hypothetical protein